MRLNKAETEVLGHYIHDWIAELNDELKRLGYTSCTEEELATLNKFSDRLKHESV